MEGVVDSSATFMDERELENAGTKRPPKMFHKKSRTGCQRCRARRVKCNEVHPTCGNCERHKLPCVYDRQKQETFDRRPIASQPVLENPPRVVSTVDSVRDAPYPESKERRILELKLLYHFINETGPTIATDEMASIALTKQAPLLAFEGHDALLFTICTLSALHAAKSDAGNPEHVDAYQLYMDLALQEHNKDVGSFGAHNVDVCLLTSSLLRICAFVLLQERSIYPYEPPNQFLQITNGAGRIFREAWTLGSSDENSLISKFFSRLPMSKSDTQRFSEENRQGLLHLLRRTAQDEAEEPWTLEIQEAYESTISVLGTVWMSITSGESRSNVFRRLLTFPMLIKKGYTLLVEQQRPRALVIAAHYFALLSMFQQIWWIGDSGTREVSAIQEVLPAEWHDLMSWPLEITSQMIVYDGDTPFPWGSDT